MKYNKIAMLVAGGLMVASHGATYGATSGTASMSATVEEWVAIAELDDVSMTQGALDGTNDLNAFDDVSDDFCIEGNDQTAAQTFTLVERSRENGATSAVLGGVSLTVQATELTHPSPDIAGSPTQDEVIDYDVTITLKEGKDHLDHSTAAGSGLDSCASEGMNYTATYGYLDDEKGQKAGSYSGTVNYTISTSDA